MLAALQSQFRLSLVWAMKIDSVDWIQCIKKTGANFKST